MESPRQWPRVLRIVVYALLVVSAVASFVLDDALWEAARRGSVPVWMVMLAPIAFTVFAALFALDRWFQVKRNGYPFAKAAFQVGLAVIFVSLLWPQQAAEMRATRMAARGEEPLTRLLRHGDADVRAMACELAGLRRQASLAEPIRELAAGERAPNVRERCAKALELLGR